MKKTINTEQAIDMLLADDNANWSVAGARAIAEYLEELGEDLGEEIELDVVAIRCDYSEITLEEVLDNYSEIKEEFEEYKKENEYEDEDKDKDIIKEIIGEHTTIIEVDDNKIIIQDF